MLTWSALYFGIKYYLLSQEEKQRYLKAISMAQEAQLKMLRYQLNPHFLFNTLNAISTLILDKDTQVANSMVMKLSRFLRYSLDNDPMQQVTVARRSRVPEAVPGHRESPLRRPPDAAFFHDAGRAKMR
jgi:two-component system LytT family sensor kinase